MGRFNTLPDWFLGTEAGQAAQAEAEDQLKDERHSIVAEIARIRSESDGELKELDRIRDAARAELQEAAKQHREAKAACELAENAPVGIRISRDHQIAALEMQLRLSADPAILEFIETMRDLWQETRRVPFERVEYGPVVLEGTRAAVNNHRSITDRMDSLRSAVLEAEGLKVLVDVDVPAKLDELRATIPRIEPAETFIPS